MAGDDAAGQRKGGGGTTPPQLPPPAEQGLRCPRCDSPNTKFCYYNNYSLSQPRHFCKTCRRYWTKGGALRNVPVGGGCRKNKRSRSAAAAAVAAAAASSSSSSRLSLNLPPMDGIGCAGTDLASGARMGFLGGGGSGIVSSSSPRGGDFQGAVGMVPLPRLHGAPAVGVTQYVPFGEWPSSSADITGGAMNGGAMSSTIASSIESLSFINQDLHWKLQQQRLATMFLGPPPSSSSVAHVDGGNNSQAAGQHAAGGGGTTFLQMAGSSSGMEPMPAATSWFMDGCSYAFPSPPPPPAAAMGLTTSSNINSGRSSGGGGDDNAATSNNNNNCGSAIPAWGDISVFAMLP